MQAFTLLLGRVGDLCFLKIAHGCGQTPCHHLLLLPLLMHPSGVIPSSHPALLTLVHPLMCRGAAVSIENPHNSYFWLVMGIFARQRLWMRQFWHALKDNIYQACMYGSKLDKWTTINATPLLYDAICTACDKSQEQTMLLGDNPNVWQL